MEGSDSAFCKVLGPHNIPTISVDTVDGRNPASVDR